MNTDTPDRIIIGEAERCGLPISAPVRKNVIRFPGKLRWMKLKHSFVLEQQYPDGTWVEVGAEI